jgi:predicted nucleotidyltransferase
MSQSLTISKALFGKTRNDLLALLFSKPGQSFYVREILRAIDAGTGAVQRELSALTKAGILKREARGRQIYYQTNPASPIYGELERIVAKTSAGGVTEILRRALADSQLPIKIAFIYGSVARGEQTAASDLDLMLIGDMDSSFVDLRVAQEILGREINVAVYPTAEFVRKARAKQHFITTVLRNQKLFVIGSEDELRALVAGKIHRATSDKR